MLPLVFLAIGTAITWGAWVFIILRFDPFVGGVPVRIMFYASIGLALIGTLLLLGMWLHKWRHGRVASRPEAGVILREALLFVTFTIVVLNLASYRLLKWWNIMPLVLLTLSVELFFNSLDKKMRRHS